MDISFCLQGFALICRMDLHRFPILRYGTARHNDALLAQNVRNPTIGQGSPRILCADQLLDQRADKALQATQRVRCLSAS